jgi:hypothetical protein
VPYAAPLHSCKYRWLHAPATIDTCSRKSPVSGDLFAFVAADSMAARFPFKSILSVPCSGVSVMASMRPRSASVAGSQSNLSDQFASLPRFGVD